MAEGGISVSMGRGRNKWTRKNCEHSIAKGKNMLHRAHTTSENTSLRGKERSAPWTV